MKRFGINKGKLNPPWPSEQPIVVIPPGSNPTSVGMPDSPVRSMPGVNDYAETEMRSREVESVEERGSSMPQGNERQFPLMGFMPRKNNPDFMWQQNNQQAYPVPRIPQENNLMMNFKLPYNPLCMKNVNEYICRQIGSQVKIEFLFGEQNNIEKVGVLREVGRDFLVIEESETKNMLVCSMKQIKFISIYAPQNTDRQS